MDPRGIDVLTGWPCHSGLDSIATRASYPVTHRPPDLNRSHPSPEKPVRVLVVDDQRPFLVAARQLIESTPGFEPVGEPTSGEHAITLAAALRPDLVLMDVRMPGLGGLAAARCITMARSAGAVVLVTADLQDVPPGAAASCGAVAVMGKQHLCAASLTALWQRCASDADDQRRPQGPSQTSATSSTS